MGSFKKIPFVIITLVLSAVLEAFVCRATVHLAALNEAELQRQYEYTMDNTMMGSSEEGICRIHDALYKAFNICLVRDLMYLCCSSVNTEQNTCCHFIPFKVNSGEEYVVD